MIWDVVVRVVALAPCCLGGLRGGQTDASGSRVTLILLAAAAPILVWVPLPTGVIPGTEIDAEDVALPLDLRSVFHADDASSITFTVEAYHNFPDDAAAFKWGMVGFLTVIGIVARNGSC